MRTVAISFFAFAFSLLISGCATVSGSGSNQSVSVQTFAADGNEVTGARCDMANDEGTWFVVTPGSTMIHRSNKDLQVICKKTGLDVGSASVVSRTKGNMWGNILLGGGIGAIVDHNNGTAYEYPGLLKIFMGRSNQKIEEQPTESQQAQTAAQTSAAQPAPSQQVSVETNLDAAKKKCEELGFVPATEQFGTCVLKLAK